jgi:glycerol-3-phosphate dehydrogenase
MDGADSTLTAEHPHTIAEIDHVIRTEMPMTIADVLARRTRIALIARDHGRGVVDRVADRLANHLRWSFEERQAQVAAYSDDVSDLMFPSQRAHE